MSFKVQGGGDMDDDVLIQKYKFKTINLRDKGIKIQELVKKHPHFKQYLKDNFKMDLGNSNTIREYNRLLFKELSNLNVFLPPNHLIPTAMLRITVVNETLNYFGTTCKRVLEIGCGSNAIISLLLATRGIQVVATEVDEESLCFAAENLKKNQVKLANAGGKVELRKSDGRIIKGIIKNNERFDLVISLPPFHPQKNWMRGKLNRGFLGTKNELNGGGEYGERFMLEIINEASDSPSITSGIVLLAGKKIQAIKAIELALDKNLDPRLVEIIAGTRKRWLLLLKKRMI